ncbi:hypothetical protein J3A84_02835 [Proteiniclasticum sp. SCR006]|uniref:Uncharacterized protein n=1 Tax=Proteiniclasticum aestuarii TaxID=2817862 RepID=A0A939HAZ1_9CLOT|nr:hypothetical protein [Proteiniclasticum aestuarii]MBO1263978.1 hypothetical protein [Proteiniclasticum aestuarii]
MRRKWTFVTGALLLLCAFIFIKAPGFAKARALLVVSLYDRYQEEQSVAEKLSISIQMPLENMEVFPILVTYNDENLSRFLGKQLHFTVDYTFGDFLEEEGHSRIYDSYDPLYNAYLGYYSITGFGKRISEEELMLLSEYDMQYLALPAVGLSPYESTFRIESHEKMPENLMLSSYPFTVYESTLTTNGPEHRGESFAPGDLLFGKSPPASVSYPLHEMKGRVYLHYYEDQDLNLIFYALGKSSALLEDFEESILKKTVISFP